MSDGTRLLLVDGFELRIDGAPVRLSDGHQHLVAFLGLLGPVARSRVAAGLWPDRTDQRAAANLRSKLFRLPPRCAEILDIDGTAIGLRGDVSCDVHDFVTYARRLADADRDGEPIELRLDAVPLSHDLLPGWYDEWVLVERERLHQRRLHALDSLCRRLSKAGRHGEAIEAGLASVRAEPLRETGQASLVAAYLAEGNRTQAIRQLERYRALLLEEIGCEPSGELTHLVGWEPAALTIG